MRLFYFLKRKKDPETKIKLASKKVNKAFNMFANAAKALDFANLELEKAQIESDNRIAGLSNQLLIEEQMKAEAARNMEKNKKLSAKLSEFLID